jgi:hypothetical protein
VAYRIVRNAEQKTASRRCGRSPVNGEAKAALARLEKRQQLTPK